MKQFDHLIKLMQTQKKLSPLRNGTDWIPKILEQQALTNNYSKKFAGITPMLNYIGQSQRFHPKQNSIDAMLKHLMLTEGVNRYQSQFAKIYSQQGVFGKSFEGIAKLLQQREQAKSLFASGNLIRLYSARIAALAAKEDDAEDLEVLREVSTQAAQIISGIEERTYVTTNDLRNFHTNILDVIDARIEEKVKEKGLSDEQAKNWEFWKGQLVSLIVGLVFWLIPSPTSSGSISQEDFKKGQIETYKYIDSLLEKGKYFRTVKKNIRLRKDPKFSSARLAYLKKGLKVQVLNSTNTWANIIIQSTDGYPINGWVPKECLSK